MTSVPHPLELVDRAAWCIGRVISTPLTLRWEGAGGQPRLPRARPHATEARRDGGAPRRAAGVRRLRPLLRCLPLLRRIRCVCPIVQGRARVAVSVSWPLRCRCILYG